MFSRIFPLKFEKAMVMKLLVHKADLEKLVERGEFENFLQWGLAGHGYAGKIVKFPRTFLVVLDAGEGEISYLTKESELFLSMEEGDVGFLVVWALLKAVGKPLNEEADQE